jgi:1-deoxyxylulose-5-phosphate synthase
LDKGQTVAVHYCNEMCGVIGPKPWDQGMSRKHILEAIDGSLRRLGTDYVDLYQLHGYEAPTPIDEALGALDEVVRAGKARYIGVSNWPAYKVARAIGRSENRNFVRIDSVQPRYNLLFRSFERDLLRLCAEESIAVIPYNPLAGGMLTGKYENNAPPPSGTRFTLGTAAVRYQERYWKEQEFATIERLKGVAVEVGMSLATLAIAWVLSNPVITAPIIGASRPQQLGDSLAALEKAPLSIELKRRLDELTQERRTVDADR